MYLQIKSKLMLSRYLIVTLQPKTLVHGNNSILAVIELTAEITIFRMHAMHGTLHATFTHMY